MARRRRSVDRVAEHNRRMWERLAKAGIAYTRPQGRPPRGRAGLRRFLDPHRRLRGIRLDGARVLVLAGGGGWDAVVFAKLGAKTTLVDISRRQVETVRRLALRDRVRVRFVQGNMKDLSRFGDASFDLVWHLHSLAFVDDAGRVMREVGRVLAPGGTYVMSTAHPTTIRLYGSFTGGGWRPLVSYFDDGPVPWAGEDAGVWRSGRKNVYAPTLEYGHRFETIVNGIAAGGMVADGLWELPPWALDPAARRPRAAPKPGSDEHLQMLFPAYIQVRARKPRRGALTR